MKNHLKKIFLLSLAGSLILPAFVFATINYSRSPAGDSIHSPVLVHYSFDNWSDIYCNFGDINNWTIVIYDSLGGSYFGDWQSKTILSKDFSFDLSPGNYRYIGLSCSIDGDYQHDWIPIEGDGVEIIFEIIPTATPQNHIIELPDNALGSTTGVIGDLIHNLFIFIEMAIGIPLGFYFTKKWINLFKF